MAKPNQNSNYRKKKNIGGLAASWGEAYRNNIASFLALRLLSISNKTAYLQIEVNGDDLRFHDSEVIHYIECKRHAPGGKWSFKALNRERVSDFFIQKYFEGKGEKANFKIILLSSDGAKELALACDLIRKGQADAKKNAAIGKVFNLPSDLNIEDFLSHIFVCTYSDFASEFIAGPVFSTAYDKVLISEVARLINERGSKQPLINLDFLKENIPDIKSWLDRKSLAAMAEEESIKIGKFYRKSVSLEEVKAEIIALRSLDVQGNYKDLYDRARIHLIAYNTNFKIVAAIIRLFRNELSINSQNAGFIASNISGNPLYQWHFLKGLKSPDWFLLLKDTLISEICNYKEDYSAKFMLLDYFQAILPNYQNEIIDLLLLLEKNTSNYQIIAKIIETLSKVQSDDDGAWTLLEKLSQHPHPWVRREIPKTLKLLSQLNVIKTMNLIKKLILYEAPLMDVTAGSPTLALTFQGRDNENFVFEESASVLAELLNRYPDVVFPISIEMLNYYLNKEKIMDKQGEIIIPYSMWKYERQEQKREYEDDRRLRLALEIEYGIKSLLSKDKIKAKKIIELLLAQKYADFYLISMRALIGTEDLEDVKLSLIKNEDIWQVEELRLFYLQTLIKETIGHDDSASKEIEKKIGDFRIENKRIEHVIKNDLNEAVQSGSIAESGPAFKKHLTVTTWAPVPRVTIDELRTKSVNKIVGLLKKIGKEDTGELWVSGQVIAEFAEERHDLVLHILNKIDRSRINKRIRENLIAGYLKGCKEDLSCIFKVFKMLKATDTWGRIEIARLIRHLYAKADKLPKSLLKKGNRIIKKLLSDHDPEMDNTLKTCNVGAMDLVTAGINSVRGIAAEAAVFCLFYYPEDREMLRLVKNIGLNDKSLAVRACVIYTMGDIVRKDLYYLTEELLAPFLDQRISGIDICLIRYLYFLNDERMKEHVDLIKLLLNSYDKKVQDKTAELVGQKYIEGFDLKKIVDELVERKIGGTEARNQLAFIFESRYSSVMTSGNTQMLEEVNRYLKQLMDPRSEPEVEIRKRAAFFFVRDETKSEWIGDFINNGFFEPIGIDITNPSAQYHAIQFIEKSAPAYSKESIAALGKVLKKDSPILSDHLAFQRIIGILKIVFPKYATLDKDEKKILDDILDFVLENGWNEAYQLFDELMSQ